MLMIFQIDRCPTAQYWMAVITTMGSKYPMSSPQICILKSEWDYLEVTISRSAAPIVRVMDHGLCLRASVEMSELTHSWRMGVYKLTGESVSGRKAGHGNVVTFIGDTDVQILDLRYTYAPTGNAREKEIIVQHETFWRGRTEPTRTLRTHQGQVLLQSTGIETKLVRIPNSFINLTLSGVSGYVMRVNTSTCSSSYSG